jgi:hypothetical protein
MGVRPERLTFDRVRGEMRPMARQAERLKGLSPVIPEPRRTTRSSQLKSTSAQPQSRGVLASLRLHYGFMGGSETMACVTSGLISNPGDPATAFRWSKKPGTSNSLLI